MKRVLLLLLLFSRLTIIVLGQEKLKNQNYSQINFALIVSNTLYLSNPKYDNTADQIKAFDLRNKEFPKITETASFLNLYYPYSWDITGEKIFYLSAYGSFGNQRFELDIDNVQKFDSLIVANQDKKFYQDLFVKYPNASKEQIEQIEINNASEMAKSRRTIIVSPLEDYEAEILGGKTINTNYLTGDNFKKYITFDIVAPNASNLEFYLRDNKQITLWDLKLPTDSSSMEGFWQEKITYVSDSIGTFKYAYFKTYKIPLGNHSVYNAIEDSLFFEGHFKVINQGNNKFIVNLHHGAIYWMGEKAIRKVGQIDLPSYTRKLKGNKVFIEDRDNKELIFFAPVTQLSKDLPFPKVRLILKDEEFKEMFKNVGG